MPPSGVRQSPRASHGKDGPATRILREKHACSHQLFLSLPLVLHTGKRWFIICPVAEHPATEAPKSSPPLPLSSVQPEASPGRTSRQATCWGQHSCPGTALYLATLVLSAQLCAC